MSCVRFYISHLSCHPPQQTASKAGRPQQIFAPQVFLVFFCCNGTDGYDGEIIDIWEKEHLVNGLHFVDRSSYSFTDSLFQCTHMCLSFFLLGFRPYQPSLINLFYISCHLSFGCPLCGPTAASPATPMAFSHIIAYQIQIPVMDKSAWADAPECPLLLSINMLPGDFVLLRCMTLWGPFRAAAELQWPQSLKVNFWHWSPFSNHCSATKTQFMPRVGHACVEQSHFHPLFP